MYLVVRTASAFAGRRAAGAGGVLGTGTTGLPKGVMLTNRNLVANMLQLDAMSHYVDGEDVTIAFLWAGATLVVMRSAARFLARSSSRRGRSAPTS